MPEVPCIIYDIENQSSLQLVFQIADFGVSDIFEGEDDTMNRFAGSPAFQTPEAIAG